MSKPAKKAVSKTARKPAATSKASKPSKRDMAVDPVFACYRVGAGAGEPYGGQRGHP